MKLETKLENNLVMRFKELIAKLIIVISAIYFFTFMLFVIDSTKVSVKTYNFLNKLERKEIHKTDLEEYSRDMSRYASALGSPINYLPSLLTGNIKNSRHVAKSIKSGASILLYLSPLIDQTESSNITSRITQISSNRSSLRNANKDIVNLFDGIEQFKASGLLLPFKKEIVDLQSELRDVRFAYEKISPLLPIAGDLLGAKNEKKYFVAMQNSAQARGTGGLLGTFAIISLNRGRVLIERVEPNLYLQVQPDIPIKVPDEYRSIYREYARSWNGSNFSPHFPYAAKIWLETWRRMTGEKLDGVLAIDAFTLKSILASTGPLDIDGKVLNKNNVIEEILSKAYQDYESDPLKRKEYLTEIVRLVASHVLSGTYSKISLLKELVPLIKDNRVLIYSATKSENAIVKKTSLAGILDDKPNNEFRLVIQNLAGNKLDYYLKRTIKIDSLECQPEKITRVRFKITNTANPTKRLPAYVNALRAQGFPNGNQNAQYLGVFLYGPTNSLVEKVFESGNDRNNGWVYQERNRTFYSVQMMLPAQAAKSFTVYFKGGIGPITSVLQPLVLPQKTIIKDSCKQ